MLTLSTGTSTSVSRVPVFLPGLSKGDPDPVGNFRTEKHGADQLSSRAACHGYGHCGCVPALVQAGVGCRAYVSCLV
ncbi:uncharacterized [Tachysurus ichikawai]